MPQTQAFLDRSRQVVRRSARTTPLGTTKRPPINRPLAHEHPPDYPHHPADPTENWIGLGDVAAIIARRCGMAMEER